MLILAGLGFTEKDLTLREIEIAKDCDKAYIETYTNKWLGDKKTLEKFIEKKIVELQRKDLELNSNKIVKEAKTHDIILFVPGDPLVATTHASLILECKKLNIKTKVIHNSSIVSAIAETGLHLYKFGATATIPFPSKTKRHLPVSVYEVLRKNKKLGLHTLFLLDIDKKPMTVRQGLGILLKLEEKMGKGIVSKSTKIVVASCLGTKKSKIVFGTIEKVKKINFCLPACIIIPGKLHFSEREFLQQFKI